MDYTLNSYSNLTLEGILTFQLNLFHIIFVVPPSFIINATTINSSNNITLVLNVSLSDASQQCLRYINASLFEINSTMVTRLQIKIVMVDRSIAQIVFNNLNLCDYSYNYSISGIGNENNILVRAEVMVLEKGNVIKH